MIEIKFYDQTPISIFWVNDIRFEFDGDIRDFVEHFTDCIITETEGAGIWIITVNKS